MSDLICTWPRTKLGSIAKSVRNGIFARRPNDSGEGERILRISSVRRGTVIVEDSRFVADVPAKKVAQFALAPGDLLLTRYNGSRHLVGISGLVPTHAGALLHPDKLIRVVIDRQLAEPRFINYQLESRSVRAFLEPRIRTSAGQSGISGADVRGIPLVVPPLEAQGQIVEILDDYLSRLDAGNSDLAMALKRAELLRDSTLSALFADAGREVRQLGEVASWSSGGTPKAGEPAYYEGGDVLWCNSGDLNDGRLRTVPKTITQLGLDNSSAKWVPAGSVLVAMYGATIGRLAINEVPMTTNQAVAAARPTPHVMTADFLFWFLRSQRRRLRSAGKGGAQPNISQGVLKTWPVPVPGLDAQAVIATKAQQTDSIAQRLERDVAVVAHRSDILRRAVLTAAFAGKLSGRHTDTEVIEELAASEC